ncbi:MAG: DNA polymerase III subunit alpha, partial [Acetatifactor sp.]|nr:DNA polymerase III subunit alpha [Acetatifactor sp.]
IYVSGHPLEEYQELLQKHVTRRSSDFALDEETGQAAVPDKAPAVIGGMIADRTIKYTKNNQVMAFINLEDLVGSVEVVIFPRDYEQYSALLTEDAKIFVRGRTSVEEDKDAKLICEQIVGFEDAAKGGELFPGRGGRTFSGGYGVGSGNGSWKPSQRNASERGENPGRQQDSSRSGAGSMPDGIWIQFPTVEAYRQAEKQLLEATADSDGQDHLVIYIRNPKSCKVLPDNFNVQADENLRQRLCAIFGEENVKIRTKAIENRREMN